MRTNRSIPDCTVVPELGYPSVGDAAAWLCEAFGFSVRVRIGEHRVQLNVGAGAVVVTEQTPGAGPSRVLVRVEEVTAHCERAKRHGATIMQQPGDQPFGERQYSVIDPAGHRWTFSQTIADVAPEEWGGISGA